MIRAALALALLAAPVAAAERVVIAGGDLAEIAFALGAGERVVGVDSTATYPPEAMTLPQIGYLRRLSAEGVLSLAPDLLILAPDAGPDVALTQIEAAGAEILKGPDAPGAAGIAEKIRFVGAALGRVPEAEALAAETEAALASVAEKVARLPERPRVLFILHLQGGAPLVGGEGTSADEIIRLAGAENAAADVEGFRPMGREGMIAVAPDVILMMESRADAAGGLDAVLASPDIAATPAGQAGRAVAMDGMKLLGFGPRTPEAIAELARLLQPEAAAGAGL
ncbi:MAG: hemin ABC transporter substrate-binding protein [Pikeienuella sp.]|uniref:heme/hemin ABC transporter substrate-binding protein n=1 Tax=Pikeienuella sp. TaxID=2831957 RepID=UPI00391AAD90